MVFGACSTTHFNIVFLLASVQIRSKKGCQHAKAEIDV
ncbi:hypothetical protein GPLA_3858 [Paraglaciecola polaris LMG 21857]|uniref:Uncharacterized protein n=1 Tax=Paraglaciecola polaris LMG 21857 TaxID=1129793 RepID=K7A1B6_9ALTE|nr:hypothetical protein GPLA_3858 [Paraglaciecola polaris LMG 21857]